MMYVAITVIKVLLKDNIVQFHYAEGSDVFTCRMRLVTGAVLAGALPDAVMLPMSALEALCDYAL